MAAPFRIPDVLEPEEISSLIESATRRTKSGVRNLCIIRLMLDAGLRAGEVLNLKSSDINWHSGKLHVRQGKGKRDRILWINQAVLSLLHALHQSNPRSAYLFCTTSGSKLDDRYVRRLVKRFGQKAGIAKDVHPHMLRHTFATDLLRKTKNIRLVQQALGHADLSTTQIYTHIANEELESAMKCLRL